MVHAHNILLHQEVYNLRIMIYFNLNSDVFACGGVFFYKVFPIFFSSFLTIQNSITKNYMANLFQIAWSFILYNYNCVWLKNNFLNTKITLISFLKIVFFNLFMHDVFFVIFITWNND